MAGRKTYTEDELQKALQDIRSGKLGTRRAAVIYNIPRSTLRNKVYKMAQERDNSIAETRDASAGGVDSGVTVPVADVMTPEDDNDDDRDTTSAGEEECPRVVVDKDKDRQPPHGQPSRKPSSSLITVEDLLRFTTEQQHQQQQQQHQHQQQQQAAAGMPSAEAIRLFLQHYTNTKLLQQARLQQEHHYRGATDVRADRHRSPSPPPPTVIFPPPPVADLWPSATAVLDPSYLAKILSASVQATATPPAGIGSPRLPPSSPPLRSIRHPQEFLKDLSVMEMMNKLLDSDQGKMHYGKVVDPRRLVTNGCSSSEPMDTGRSNDDDSNSPSFILRVPSYKSVPGKESEYESAIGTGEPRSPPGHANSVRSDTSSPPSSSGGGRHQVNIRDVIAKSITHKFHSGSDRPTLQHMPAVESFALAYQQYQQHHQQQSMAGSAVFGPSGPVVRNHNNNNLLDDYRKRVPTPTKPTSAQMPPSGGFHHVTGGPSSSGNSSTPSSAAAAAAAAAAAVAAGGKGTRPKRGKYRNYDRDSLVEAVRAVQRGEMSVHRAGSYYGVPHSTLEYKVKERHLMRPRKREPKNPPSASSSVSIAAATGAAVEHDRKKSSSDLSLSSSSSSARSAAEKSAASAVKLPAHVFSSQQQPPPPPSQPSSLQAAANGLKMFDAASVPVGPFQPSFPFWGPSPFHVPIDFQRNSMQAYTSMSMIQRMQAESQLHQQAAAAASIASLGKNAREVAESLYDGTDNGSFLDGIIRSSLETGLKSAAACRSGLGRAADGSPERGVPDDCRSQPTSPLGTDGGRDHSEERAVTPQSGHSAITDSEDEKPTQPKSLPPDDTEHAARPPTSSPEHAVQTDNED